MPPKTPLPPEAVEHLTAWVKLGAPWPAESRGRRTEDGGQKTEDGGWRTEDRGPRTEDGGLLSEEGSGRYDR
jgi:hypothetical protein